MALARLLAVLILSCLLLGASAAPRVARCATDGNIKSPLSLLIAPSQAEWTPQLSGWTIRVPWAQIEPAEGKYVFTAIDDQLTYADNSDAYGLQGVNIEVTTGDSTPGWLLVPTPSGLVSPYWQARYQQAYRELMARLAYRYDSHRLVRGVALSACTPSSAPAEAAAAAGFNALLGLQCHYSAMFTHVSFWVNTPTLLSLPYKVDDAFRHVVEDFRAYFGPRLGVLAATQDLGAATNKDLFELLKHHRGANTVTLTGTLPGNGNIENFFAVAANSHVTGLTLPSRWNTVGDNFVAQWQLDSARSSFASLPNDCAYAPGRAVLSQSVASVPSAYVDMRMSLSPDAPISKEKILNAIVTLTGMPVSRFQVAKMLPFDGKLNARTFVYNQHYAVPAALVARYVALLSANDWRSVGLEARSIGAKESLGTDTNGSSLDATYIFLIVLAAVVYLCVIVLFCYLMAVVIRYCTSERNATMATISSAGNRVRGWVRFDKDETPGFPTTTAAKTAPVTGDAV